MAINRFIDTDLVIEDLLQETGKDSQVYNPTFRRWIKKAYSYMNDITKALDEIIEVHTVENCGIPVPKNATVLDVMISGDYGCECTAFLNTIVSGQAIETMPCIAGIDYTVENDRLRFTRADVNGEVFTVRWYGYKTDCKGKFMINELAVNACIAYCKHMLAQRSIFTSKEFRLTDGMIMFLKQDWQRKLAEARADMIQSTDAENASMAAMLNVDPLSYSIGYSRGMGCDLVGSFNNW